MRELHTFYKEQTIDTAEVPAIVAGDLNAESLQEVTAVGRGGLWVAGFRRAPLLFASNEVPSPVTSCVWESKCCRRCGAAAWRCRFVASMEPARRDVVAEHAVTHWLISTHGHKSDHEVNGTTSSSRTTDLERLMTKAPPPLNDAACIPDATHPSDHLPVIGSFRFADRQRAVAVLRAARVRDILVDGAAAVALRRGCASLRSAWRSRGRETARNAYKNGLCAEGDVDTLREAIDVPRDDERPHLFLHHAHTAALERSAGVDAAARLAFRFFDRDDDGFVARGELFKTLETILPADVFSEAAVDRIFAAVDRDHDGKVSPERPRPRSSTRRGARAPRAALSRRDRRGRLGC